MSSNLSRLSIFAAFALSASVSAAGGGRSATPVDTQPGGIFCLADLNRDLHVDAADLGLLVSQWGTGQPDFNGDGSTNGFEIGYLMSQWGSTCHNFHSNVVIAVEGEFLVVTGTGIPDHEYGNFPGECGNPNSVGNQNDTWMIPLEPEMTGSPAVDALVQPGPIGIMVNGVAFYNPYDGGGITAPDTICMDACNAHPSPDARYHYHQYSPCIEPYSGGHSTLIGYAFDGIPVYGPWEEDGILAAEMDGKRTLDACNGHDDPARGYHYHAISYQLALERNLPNDGFPWNIGCFAAEPETSNFAGGGGGAGEVLDGRVPLHAKLLAEILLLGAIHISDDNRLAGLVLVSELVPSGFHRLAVASPRRLKLDEDRFASGFTVPIVWGQ